MIKRLTSIVVSLHLLLILFLLLTPPRLTVKKNYSVKVRTLQPAVVAKHSPQRPTPSTSQPQKASSPKKPQTPKPSPKTPAPKKNTALKKPAVVEKGKPIKKAEAPKKTAPPADIWKEIDQALAKIETKSYSTKKPSLDAVEPIIPTLAPLNQSSDESVPALIIGFLHESLHLPEVGEVRIQLTIRKDGTVSNVVVVSAESRKNKLYLQEHLPLLRFPMQLEEEKTWTLTFYNEI